MLTRAASISDPPASSTIALVTELTRAIASESAPSAVARELVRVIASAITFWSAALPLPSSANRAPRPEATNTREPLIRASSRSSVFD